MLAVPMAISLKIIGSLLIIAAAIWLIGKVFRKKERSDFYSLFDSHPQNAVFGKALGSELQKLSGALARRDSVHSFKDRYHQYTELFMQDMPAGMDDRERFDQFTTAQKVLYAFMLFDTQTDNGGVYQFLFNYPHYAFATGEALAQLGVEKLKGDYMTCVNEFVKSLDTFVTRKEQFNDPAASETERWKGFSMGYTELPSAEIIQQYYYAPHFKEDLYQSVVTYIEDHSEQFIVK